MTSKCPRVVIIGAGAAGVFTALRLCEMYGDEYEVVLLEKHARVGGNTGSLQIEVGGKPYNIDTGAQFFYRNPQPSYVRLLAELGLFDKPRQIEARATGVSLWDAQARDRLLWIPARVGGFAHYRAQDWERLTDFATFMAYAFLLDRDHPDEWSLSVEDWCARLDLVTPEFRERVLPPFLYQFVTLPARRIAEASALYAITYFVRNVFGAADELEPDPAIRDPRGVATFEVYQSEIGLDGVLCRALEHVDVTPRLCEPVEAVHELRAGGLEVVTSKDRIHADHVVFATDPQTAARILEAGKFRAPGLIADLRLLEYDCLPITIQSGGSAFMPTKTRYQEAVNTIVDGDRLTFTVWFGPLRDTYAGGKRIRVFKSWASPDLEPQRCPHNIYAHAHDILLPTTQFMAARQRVAARQGRYQLWFAGGWTNWFDSQEAALDSATQIAERLPGEAEPGTGRDAMIGCDRDADRKRIDRWLARIAARAPRDRRKRLRQLMAEVEARG